MRWIKLALALVLGVWLVEQTHAQEKPRPGIGRGFGAFGAGRLFLLSQESVQADLKLTEEQKSKIRSLQEEQRQALQGLANLGREERAKRLRELAEKTDKELASLLKPAQSKRLNQIRLQLQVRQGNYANILNDPEIVEQLSLTNEQKEKVRQLNAEADNIRQSFQQGNREEIFKRMKELQGKYEAVLTEQQKSKLKELGGEPFTGEIRFGGFGGQPGRPGAAPGKPGLRPRKPNP
uniref:Hypothetical conserved protein n=1 Tax=uncultured Planctomycetota bacterium TaxID=120965 RepID=H5SBZ2_9BACT|nr:hypothetical conserved protein [uncultured Planctomycetota bacterium]